MIPGQGDIYTSRSEFDEMAWLIEERVVFIEASHVGGHNTGKVTGPFRRSEVVVITRRNDVDTLEVGFVDPLLILEDVFRQSTAETAIENMIAAIDRLPDSFANDNCARTEILAQNANTADFRVGRETTDHSRDSGTMPVDVAAVPGLNFDLDSGIDHVKVVQEADTNQTGMIDFNP